MLNCLKEFSLQSWNGASRTTISGYLLKLMYQRNNGYHKDNGMLPLPGTKADIYFREIIKRNKHKIIILER